MFVNCSTCTDSVLGRNMSPFYLNLMLFFSSFVRFMNQNWKLTSQNTWRITNSGKCFCCCCSVFRTVMNFFPSINSLNFSNFVYSKKRLMRTLSFTFVFRCLLLVSLSHQIVCFKGQSSQLFIFTNTSSLYRLILSRICLPMPMTEQIPSFKLWYRCWFIFP